MKTTKIIDKVSQKPLITEKEYNNFGDAIAEAEFVVKQLALKKINACLRRTGDREYTVMEVENEKSY